MTHSTIRGLKNSYFFTISLHNIVSQIIRKVHWQQWN